MTSFSMSWAFVMNYDHHKQTMNIQCSESFQVLLEFDALQVTLNHDDLMKCVHMYDYRKLSYFSNADLKSTFDTLIRIRLQPQGPYIRTIAVCNQTDSGFSCMHMIEAEVLKMRHTMHVTDPFANIHLEMMDGDWIRTMNLQEQLPKFKTHLKALMDRT